MLACLVVVSSFVLAPLNYARAASHANGTNIVSNGTVYMVVNGQKRAYTSAGAFLSYGFNSWGTVQQASAEDIALPEGNFIPPRDGKIVCSDRSPDKGTCYLITNSKRSAFVSSAVFGQLGFSFSKALYGDVSFLEKDSDISNSSDQHKAGVLINKNGTIYLVSSKGLIGIPNPDVLLTWGYSFADAVKANSSDYSLSESSVMTARVAGQLNPANVTPLSTLAESVLIKSYIEAYPALPTEEINSPEDVEAILLLDAALESDATFDDLYPYLSSNTLAVFEKVPALKQLMRDEVHRLAFNEIADVDVQILLGGTIAKVIVDYSQQFTDYEETMTIVFVKENGLWKVDMIGTLKIMFDEFHENNPNDQWITGSGSTNLSIIEMFYGNEEVQLNDSEEEFYAVLKNKGKTTIHNYLIALDINGTNVYFSSVIEKLRPGDEIIIAIPIASFWDKNIIREPGTYRTDFAVGFGEDTSDLDRDTEDNSFYMETEFIN